MNIQDGQSYVQVADGALLEVESMMNRVLELSTQACNGTYDDLDREAIDNEITEIKSEMERIFTTTKFNDVEIWGDKNCTSVQYGKKDVPTIKFGPQNVSYKITDANKAYLPKNQYFNFAADDNGITVSWTGFDGKNYTTSQIPFPNPKTEPLSFNIQDYTNPKLDLDFPVSYTPSAYATEDDVVNALNGKSMYLSFNTAEPTTSGNTQGGNSQVSFSTHINHDAALDAGKDFDIYDTDFIQGGTVSASNVTKPAADADKWIFTFEMPVYNNGVDTGTKQTVTATSYDTDYVVNTYDSKYENNLWYENKDTHNKYHYRKNPSTDDGSLGSALECMMHDNGAILLKDNPGGGWIYVDFNISGTSGKIGSMEMSVWVAPEDTIDDVREKLLSFDYVDIANGSGATPSHETMTLYLSSSNTVEQPLMKSVYDIPIHGGNHDTDIIHITYDQLNIDLLGLTDISLATIDEAVKTTELVNEALRTVVSQHGIFGGYTNRFEHAMDSNGNTAENSQAAESRIRDTDMAKEMMQMTKSSILTEAAQSMLAQANQQPSQVLTLLDVNNQGQ